MHFPTTVLNLSEIFLSLFLYGMPVRVYLHTTLDMGLWCHQISLQVILILPLLREHKFLIERILPIFGCVVDANVFKRK